MCGHWHLKEGVPTIVFLSRLHPKKGLELLISAVSQLKSIEFQLVIAGEGDQHAGHEKNLLLQGADIFALTSHSENFGIAALEAMAAGTAVLMSNEVALSSLVEQYQLGFITQLNEQDIINALNKALNELDTTHQMGRNGQNLVKEHYQWPTISKKLVTLYQSLS